MEKFEWKIQKQMKKTSYELLNLTDTKFLAQEIAKKVQPNLYLLLSGDLGSGKTTFTKALLKELKVDQKVTSPTFVIVNHYETETLPINHMDAYRLKDSDELSMYLEDADEALNIIEWYENLNLDLSNLNYIKINFIKVDNTKRLVDVEEK